MNQGKFARGLLMVLMVGLLITPALASAQDFWAGLLPSMNLSFGSEDLLDVISSVINLAFAMAAIVAVIYLIIGGYSYVTAGGNPEAVEMAKTTIVNALIGLLVILVSYLIVQFVMNQLDVDVELPN
jgi:hypothetical protein